FVQDGGRVHSLIEINAPGTYPQYVLNNGINYGGVSVAGNPRYGGIAQALQNGGTNFGPIQVGGENFGYYTLSNGVVSSPIIKVIREGSFHQTGGIVTTASKLTVQSGPFSEGYVLIGGSLSSPGIDLALYSSFTQSGGTNNIAGDLSIVSSSDWRSHGYEITGGQLSVSNIVVSSYSTFTHSGGMVSQSGTLTLETSTFFAAPGNHQFGPLKLSGSNALVMPVTSSTLRFRNSSGLAWSSIASLIISNWSGSYLGDGRQRIIFGNSSSALTPQQLRQILFAYPANLAYGIYPAKILSTGEIVPDGLPPTGHNPSRVAVRESSPGYTMEISVTGDAGYDYGLLTSYDLVNWHLLTNHVATNGTFSVTDLQYQWPYYLRYYKAVLMR
ncbi:MAG TPA: hypothetical protein VJ063_15980, partial [Verrucomicrobiae bacterium]|nr:hypothetical protein [Verrucomicrobiae bacterium]